MRCGLGVHQTQFVMKTIFYFLFTNYDSKLKCAKSFPPVPIVKMLSNYLTLYLPLIDSVIVKLIWEKCLYLECCQYHKWDHIGT